MSVYRHRVLLLCLLLFVACGGGTGSGDGGDGSGSGSGDVSQDPAVEESDSGDGSVDLSGNGTVRFEIGGNVDSMEGEWYFFPPASAYIDGNWALTFVPNSDGSGEGLLTISLQEDANYVSFASTDLSLVTNPEVCEVDVDHSDSGGASGSFTCSDAAGFRASGATVDGVTFSGTFEANA